MKRAKTAILFSAILLLCPYLQASESIKDQVNEDYPQIENVWEGLPTQGGESREEKGKKNSVWVNSEAQGRLPEWKRILNQGQWNKGVQPTSADGDYTLVYGQRPNVDTTRALQNEFKLEVIEVGKKWSQSQEFDEFKTEFILKNSIQGQRYILIDDMVTKTSSMSVISKLRERNKDKEMTFPSWEDPKYDDTYKEQLGGLTFTPGPGGCVPGLNEGSNGDCFSSLDEEVTMIYPETLPSMTYLASLNNVTSIVDRLVTHVCDVSVYKKGVWVTASHCIKDNVTSSSGVIVQDENGIIVENKIVPLKGLRFIGCGERCDIVLIELETPANAIYPYLISDSAKFSAKEGVFVPGMRIGEPLDHILDGPNEFKRPDPKEVRARYNEHVAWSPYGAGYCKILKQYPDGCLIHGCNSVIGFSGAPMYSYDMKLDKVKLMGIHSGIDNSLNGCELQRDKQGKTLATNYARLISTSGAKK